MPWVIPSLSCGCIYYTSSFFASSFPFFLFLPLPLPLWLSSNLLCLLTSFVFSPPLPCTCSQNHILPRVALSIPFAGFATPRNDFCSPRFPTTKRSDGMHKRLDVVHKCHHASKQHMFRLVVVACLLKSAFCHQAQMVLVTCPREEKGDANFFVCNYFSSRVWFFDGDTMPVTRGHKTDIGSMWPVL